MVVTAAVWEVHQKSSYLTMAKTIRLLNSRPREFPKEIEYSIFVANYSQIKKKYVCL